MRAVGRSVGNGPVRSTQAIARMSLETKGDVVSYAIQMGKLGETPLGCSSSHTWRTTDEAALRRFRQGDFVRLEKAGVSVGSRLKVGLGVRVQSLRDQEVTGCAYHGASHESLRFLFAVDDNATTVPRGAFNPRFDRSYTRTYRHAPPNAAPDHGRVVDRNQLHTVQVSEELTISVKAISEKTSQKRAESYRKYRTGRLEAKDLPVR